MLSTPPDSQSSDYALEGGASALRKGRYPQAADDTLTRPLFPPGQSDQVYHLHVKSTSNNTIITLTDPQGGALKGGSASGGTVGFKGVGKSGYEAGYQCALRIFARIAELKRTVNRAHGDLKIELLLNGMFGQGREAMYRALMTQDGEHVRQIISRVTDTTRIRVGGTRPKKRRVL
ncbi:translational machinery component [Ceratobasidium sp. AG-I]|nr:translational machinery component [Ceratobasidium sp. AG-I]